MFISNKIYFLQQVLVVGNPANTNCCIAKHFAPSIPAKNFSCLTRLDQNRACAQVDIKVVKINFSNSFISLPKFAT